MSTLYVSDLDGTLLRNDGTLSQTGRATLQRLLNDGLVFSVASARSVVSMRPILGGLRFSLPVIAFNGAYISDLATGRHEIVNSLDPEVARDIFALMQRFGWSPFLATFNGEAERVYYDEATNQGERYYVSDRILNNDDRFRRTRDMAGPLQEQVVCLTVIGEEEALAEVELAIRERYADRVEMHLFENFYSPGWYWLTVHDRRATKAQAVSLIVKTYNLSDHELVVFGDHINDIKMFQIAAQAVAVENAHPEAKRHATRVIGSNEEDSVVEFIHGHHVNKGKSQPT